MEEENICEIRRTAYGLYGCQNCPIACPLQSDNLNKFQNLDSQIPKTQKPNAFMTSSVLNITEDDVWTLAQKENIKIPEEKKEHVIYMVKKYLEGYCFDCTYNVWDAIKDAIKEALL